MSGDPFDAEFGDESPDLPARTVGAKPPVRFDCPACGASLRMRPGSAGRAVDCPECGAGLILAREPDGGVRARAVGADAAGRRVPLWPALLGVAGVACAAAAGWVVLGGGRPAAPAKVAGPVEVVEPDPVPAVPEVPAEPIETGEVEHEAPAKPQAGGDTEESVEDAGPVPPSDPARPAVVAPGPRADLGERRVGRRLDAELGSFVMTSPAPLATAVEDLEDLLRVRIAVEANRTTPVLVEFPGPVTVREVLAEMARQGGLEVSAEGGAVRLAPAGR